MEYTLYNGTSIPSIGFGTWKVPDGQEVCDAVSYALECGYTHIDTASAYYNETGIGYAIKNSGMKREALFITTKLWNTEQGYESTLASFESSMKKLGIGYLDLYLMHWPRTYVYYDEYPQRMRETWRAFEKLYKEGAVRAIGVSNFLEHHINTLMETAEVLPMVNQLEIHPGYNQQAIVDYCQEHKIIVESWSPFASGKMFQEGSLLETLGKKYGKTPAQIALRWHLQRGLLPLPKTVTPSRIKENIDIFDFELESEDAEKITEMPESGFSGYHPDHIDFLKNLG